MLQEGWSLLLSVYNQLTAKSADEWRDSGMVMCLDQGADLRMAQLMLLPLTISCCSTSRLILPFCCRLTGYQ